MGGGGGGGGDVLKRPSALAKLDEVGQRKSKLSERSYCNGF